MDNILSDFKSSITIWFILLIIGIGFFEWLYDSHILKREGLIRESSIAKFIGVTYVVIGIVVYGFVKLI